MDLSSDKNGKIFVGIPRERISFNQFIDNRDMIFHRLNEINRLAAIYTSEGHRVDRNREKITEAFMAHSDKPPWLLMIDTDMEHPITAPERLTSYGLPIVGALYFHRGEGHEPFVFKYSGLRKDQYGRDMPIWTPHRDLVYRFLEDNMVPMRDGALIIDGCVGEHLINCDAVATGCIVIHRSVFEKIPPPWWEYIVGGVSEDLSFCMKAKEAGFDIYADLSTICGHYHWVAMGQAQFRLNYQGRGIGVSSYSKRDAITMLQEFLKISEKSARRKIEKSSGSMVGKLWNKHFKDKPITPEAIRKFYNSREVGETYLLELLFWNFTQDFQKLRSTLVPVRNMDVIEIGAGIGTVALQLILQNNNVLAVEVNKFLRDFIDYRWRKITEDFVEGVGELSIVDDQWREKCPDESFDIAISFDTFEHLAEDDLKDVLRNIYRVLKPGGKLVYHANWAQQDLYPMHFDYSEWFSSFCASIGFVEIGPMEMMKEIEHVDR